MQGGKIFDNTIMDEKHVFGPTTTLIHGKFGDAEDEHASHVPPLYETSTYKIENTEEAEQIISGSLKKDFYGRRSGPTQRILERKLCFLEAGEAAQVFDSGMSAINTLFKSILASGDEVIAHRNLYGKTCIDLKDLSRFGVTTHFVDARETQNVLDAITSNTRMVFLESPSNPMLDICDYEAIKHNIVLAGRKDVVVAVEGPVQIVSRKIGGVQDATFVKLNNELINFLESKKISEYAIS